MNNYLFNNQNLVNKTNNNCSYCGEKKSISNNNNNNNNNKQFEFSVSNSGVKNYSNTKHFYPKVNLEQLYGKK